MTETELDTRLEVTQNSEVFMHFSVKLDDGSVADSTHAHQKPAKLVLGNGTLTEGLEQNLLGMKAGDKGSFTLPPEQAFGESNPDNIHHMDRSRFTGIEIEVGTILSFDGPSGKTPGVVREISGESVTIDFNHPLAGQTVTFEVEILKVVPASEDVVADTTE